MEHHEAAAIFPMMEGDDYENFRQDIKENGLKEAIVTFKGKIIDGRNRERACKETGRKAIYVEWDGEGSLTDYIVSLNLHRRHLSTTQRAMLGAKIRDSLRDEARARMNAGTRIDPSENSGYPPVSSPGKSSEQAAAVVKTSTFPVEKASFVLAHGSPELLAAVQADQVAVHNAADLAKLPHAEQASIVAQGPDVMLEKAKEIRQQKKPTEDPKPGRLSEEKPVAARGVSAVGKYLDRRIDFWSKSKEAHAEAVFAELQAVRKELVGR